MSYKRKVQNGLKGVQLFNDENLQSIQNVLLIDLKSADAERKLTKLKIGTCKFFFHQYITSAIFFKHRLIKVSADSIPICLINVNVSLLLFYIYLSTGCVYNKNYKKTFSVIARIEFY